MFSSFRSKSSYSAIKEADYDDELKVGIRQQAFPRHTIIKISLFWALGLTLLLCFSTTAVCALFIQHMIRWNGVTSTVTAEHSCFQPTIRREWRTLTLADKNDYITAVQCLGTVPSRLRENGTLYDDFPWVHKLTAPNAHASAPFLPWHRYYIHAYEEALKSDCFYKGSLPYWDWSRDWKNFENAPVWDQETGFGGDGNATGETTVGDGRCVIDGPFAGLEAMFYDDRYLPHCLSRGFAKDAQLSNLCKLVQPEVMERILREPEFETFASELEKNAHTFISGSIRGDFSKYTGPYDPVFFLHHVNLDRLWWIWQQKDPHRKHTVYNGKANSYTIKAASLTDVLDIGGLLNSVRVSEVMETTSGSFCYRY